MVSGVLPILRWCSQLSVTSLLMLRDSVVQNLVLTQALGLYYGNFRVLAESLRQVEINRATRRHDLPCLERLLPCARNIVDIDQKSLLIVLLDAGDLLGII